MIGVVFWSLLACNLSEQPEEVVLAIASEEVTFQSVTMLGPHRYLATISRTEEWGRRDSTQHSEIVEIQWIDWDNFSYKREVDGDVASATRVVEGQAWIRHQERRWDARSDAEPYRVQLQTTWDTWEQTLKPFGERVEMVEVGREELDGREVIKYELLLSPLPQGEVDQGLAPTSLTGTVWVDVNTAVRLVGVLEGELADGVYRRSVSLKLARSEIGIPQAIAIPRRVRSR